MSLIPLLDDSTDSIRQSLSLEEIQIAFSFLRKRFKEYSPKEIVLSLNEYILQQEYSAIKSPTSRSKVNRFHRPYNRVSHGHNHQHFDTRSSIQERIEHKEEVKLVAKLFCESGIKYSLTKYFFPEMSLKKYESLLQLIAAQTLNNIEKYLQYECNINIEQLSKAHKRSIRDKLVHIRDWMAKQQPKNFQTYMKFIERHYQQNQRLEIDYRQAFSLYKFILEMAKGPEMNLEQLQINDIRPHINMYEEVNIGSEQPLQQSGQMNSEEIKALLILVKKYGSISKTSDYMCQRFGYNLKWSKHSIKMFLKKIYKTSLRKLIESSNQYLPNQRLMFGYGEQDVNAIFQYDNSTEVKCVLLDFYGLKKITVLKLKECIQKTNDFYTKEFSPDNIYEQIEAQRQTLIPQLVKSERQTEPIEVKDQQDEVKDEVIEIELQMKGKQNYRNVLKNRKITNKRKKVNFKEVIEIEQSIDGPKNINATVGITNEFLSHIQQEQRISKSKISQRENQVLRRPIIGPQKPTQFNKTIVRNELTTSEQNTQVQSSYQRNQFQNSTQSQTSHFFKNKAQINPKEFESAPEQIGQQKSDFSYYSSSQQPSSQQFPENQ